MKTDVNYILTQMGSTISKVTLDIFEFFNEIFVAAGAGLVGIGVVLINGFASEQVFLSFIILSVAIAILYYCFQTCEKVKPTRNKVVFITGCDSGLGFSIAQHASDIGFQVIAGCLNLDSDGSKELEKLYGQQIQRIRIDITSKESIDYAVAAIYKYLEADSDLEFWALVNNAGKMTFGEFEWQTPELMEKQISTNLLGTMLVTKAFAPIIRGDKARIINVTSHCAKATLPGLAVYGATKAAVNAWTDGLRVEMKKYGVHVINFIPGSFSTQSHIMANHVEEVYEMQKQFTPEQKAFYGDYFKRYNAYLNCIATPTKVTKIKDNKLYSVLEHALTDTPPYAEYVNEPFRYAFYYRFFKYAPTSLRDKAVEYFMKMPEYHNEGRSVHEMSL